HARLLYAFLETPAADRPQDDVISEDYGHPAAPIPLPAADRLRLNKDLLHLTYSRLRHTKATKPWPDSILATLHHPVIGFMRHVETQADLFPDPDHLRFWQNLISLLDSGRQLIIRSTLDTQNRATYQVSLGHRLPNGKPALTVMGVAAPAVAT